MVWGQGFGGLGLGEKSPKSGKNGKKWVFGQNFEKMGKIMKNRGLGAKCKKSGKKWVFPEYVRPSAFTFSNYFGESVFD